MKAFLDEDFLLSNETAKLLFHKYANKQPIIDYHCHINPQEIAEDRTFENITQVWLGGDHYKWRLMRSCGVDEAYITGSASDKEKFFKFAECLSTAIGNPLYHWSHLELQRYFGFHGYLTKENAEEVWDLCNKKLQDVSMSVRGMIAQSNVTHICTTDDPIDSLIWHKKIAEDTSFSCKVLPAFRPDKAMNVEKNTFSTYIQSLSDVSGIKIQDFSDLKAALTNRLEYFSTMGCTVSDHALEYVIYVPSTEEEIDEILKKGLNNLPITREEELKYKTAFMIFVGREYHRLNWVMQLHYGCKRDNNQFMFDQMGADTGFDCINNYAPSAQLADFLNALVSTNQLPKTILYSLNPNDNEAIGTILGCFQDSSVKGKVQHGSAWWFNDTKTGMIAQLTSLANLGNLAGFVGMLTDSRSFLSYTRHEYFRRILCNLLGTWVENGEYPFDEKLLQKIVEDISYNNTLHYFRF